jgi:uncharacterized protein YutE (UPF0331/DUF86 family)
MTDVDLLTKRLAFIETCLRELRELARPGDVSQDVREERFVEHTLQLAIQAAMDIASHIVSDDRLGEPASNRELFDLLARAGWISGDSAERAASMAGFRNVLVHGYAEVDLALVEDILVNHLADFDTFVAAIRNRLGELDR